MPTNKLPFQFPNPPIINLCSVPSLRSLRLSFISLYTALHSVMTSDMATTSSAGLSAVAAAAPVTKVRSSASTTSQAGYPLGHLGHLTAREEAALDTFKGLLEERGLYTRGLSGVYDDQTLLRYLRARRWNPEDAYRQFKETQDWRAANHIDTLYRTIDLEAFEQSRRL
ncbi:hypothetical protein E4U43_006223, partial [Claviceps pusilla]